MNKFRATPSVKYLAIIATVGILSWAASFAMGQNSPDCGHERNNQACPGKRVNCSRVPQLNDMGMEVDYACHGPADINGPPNFFGCKVGAADKQCVLGTATALCFTTYSATVADPSISTGCIKDANNSGCVADQAAGTSTPTSEPLYITIDCPAP